MIFSFKDITFCQKMKGFPFEKLLRTFLQQNCTCIYCIRKLNLTCIWQEFLQFMEPKAFFSSCKQKVVITFFIPISNLITVIRNQYSFAILVGSLCTYRPRYVCYLVSIFSSELWPIVSTFIALEKSMSLAIKKRDSGECCEILYI